MLPHTITGGRDKPPVVFLHGFIGCKEDWHEIARSFSHAYCCYSLDLPGHGKAPPSEDYLSTISDTLDQLNINECTLVGYSMGGRIALQLGNLQPHRFSKKIILGAHFGLENEIEKKERWELDQKWISFLEKESMEVFLEKWYQQPIFIPFRNNIPAFQKAMIRRLDSNPKNLAKTLSIISLAKQEVITEFTDSFFLVGGLDTKFYRHYQKHLSPDQFQTIPEAGHVAHLEQPEAFIQTVLSYLEEQTNVLAEHR